MAWKIKSRLVRQFIDFALAHKFQRAKKNFRFFFLGFYILVYFSFFMQMHKKCHDYRVFVCLFCSARRTCSASMLDVVCARTCLTQRWPLELSRHRNCSIFEHMFGFSSVCIVCGLIIEMVPQGDVSSTSQTLSFILVVSQAPALFSLSCLSLFIL